MVFPYEELDALQKQTNNKTDYLDQLATIGSYALDDLEALSDDIQTKEAFRELNIAVTGLADYLMRMEVDKEWYS